MVGKLMFIVGRVAGLSAEVLEEHTREKPMRIKIPVAYDGVPPRGRTSDYGHRSVRTESAHARWRSNLRTRPAGARPRGHARDRRATIRRRSIGCAAPWPGPAATKTTATRLAQMSVDESGMGSPEPRRRAKVLGHSARRAAPEEHRDHRGDPGKGDRQMREAGGRHRLADSGDEPVRDADRHRDLRHQMQGRGDLLTAPGEQEDDERDGSRDAGARPRRWRVPRTCCSASSVPSIPLARRADEHLRPDDRDRRTRRW